MRHPQMKILKELFTVGKTFTACTEGTLQHPQRDKTEGHFMSAAGKFKDATGRLKQDSPLPFLMKSFP